MPENIIDYIILLYLFELIAEAYLIAWIDPLYYFLAELFALVEKSVGTKIRCII